ncbi:MAG TPA: hydantoinase B/oxoprolinase family protein, partial [Candidatus Obscuribacterales bacterium]
MSSAITLEIYKHRFQAIAEEMGVTLCRSAYSSNIKERRDFSCALFDAQGHTIAQAEHLPVHLGSMPMSVQAALDRLQLEPGDSVLLNDPFAGGTHLPDITMVDPVFLAGEAKPAFFVANRAHHADVGGMTPGSMPLSGDIFQEGLRIPPLKWRKRGEIDADLLALILNNVRTPAEREGDLLAQWAANRIGALRLQALCLAHGPEQVRVCATSLQDYAERMLRDVLRRIPDGQYAFSDRLEDDGKGNLDLQI